MTVETMQDSDLKSSTGVFADSQNPNTKPLLRKFEKAGNSTDIKYSRKKLKFQLTTHQTNNTLGNTVQMETLGK